MTFIILCSGIGYLASGIGGLAVGATLSASLTFGVEVLVTLAR